MLSSIAGITGATVFASSDDTDADVTATWPVRIVKVDPRDYCLEFVVGPDGKQIPWIFTLPGDSERPINRVFDPQIWGNPQAIDVDKPNEWPYVSAVPIPRCTIPTIGENFITKYDPL